MKKVFDGLINILKMSKRKISDYQNTSQILSKLKRKKKKAKKNGTEQNIPG